MTATTALTFILATTTAGWIFTIIVFAFIFGAIWIGWRLGGVAGQAANDLHAIRRKQEEDDERPR